MANLAPYQRQEGLTWKQYLVGNLFTLAGNAIIAKSVESGIRYEISNIADGINSLSAKFNYGMTLILQQLEAQNKSFENIFNKLDEIHETLKNPLLTKATEYRNMGMERLARGLLDKAIESFLESEKKNDTDSFVQMQLGKLYMYGKDVNYDIVDMEKAEKHLELAHRYGEA